MNKIINFIKKVALSEDVVIPKKTDKRKIIIWNSWFIVNNCGHDDLCEVYYSDGFFGNFTESEVIELLEIYRKGNKEREIK